MSEAIADDVWWPAARVLREAYLGYKREHGDFPAWITIGTGLFDVLWDGLPPMARLVPVDPRLAGRRTQCFRSAVVIADGDGVDIKGMGDDLSQVR
jgi:hypothetical protein